MDKHDILMLGIVAALLLAFFGNVKAINLTYGQCTSFNDSNGTVSEFCAPVLSNAFVQLHPADFGVPAFLNYTCFSGEIVNNSLPFYQNVTVQNVTLIEHNVSVCNNLTDLSQVWFSSRPIEVNATVQINLTNIFQPNLTIQPQVNITVLGCNQTSQPNQTAAPLITPALQTAAPSQGSDLIFQMMFVVLIGGALFIYWQWRNKNNAQQRNEA